MELSSVKKIITPQGSLKKIIRNDGVVIWSKKSLDLTYTIWKDGVLIDTVTIADFVNKIHSGYAQENYGIGAQIMIPYTDPFNDVTYDCPFNFGTFTQYPGKLGLQTHYALPSKAVAYGAQVKHNSAQYYYYCIWRNSYMYNWLNTNGIVDGTNYGTGTNGFLSCIPADFVEAIQSISFMNTDCQFFLLTATQSCAARITTHSSTGAITGQIWTSVEDEGEVWEYWQNKIGEPQKYDSSSAAIVLESRIVTNIADKIERVNVKTPTIIKPTIINTSSFKLYHATFKKSGSYNCSKSDTAAYYQPACVIG